METVINIKVFAPSWLEMSTEVIELLKGIKEPDDLAAMKYQEGISFDFGFDILNYTVKHNTTHEISLTQDKKSINYTLDDVLLINFEGQNENRNVIISNNLLCGNFEAQKSGAKQYMYFYLNGNLEYKILADNIWLSKDSYIDLCRKFPNSLLHTGKVNRHNYRGML